MNNLLASSIAANRCSATRHPFTVRDGTRTAGWIALLIAAALGTGCATTPQSASNTEPPSIATSLSRPDGAVRVDTDNAEAAKLWASAERATSEGKTEIALELVYAALDIDPQNSLLWSRAAELQLDALDPQLAESFAMRSNTWAGNNRPLLYRNWLIIEHARSMRGDLLGVRSAHKQVQAYQSR